MALFGRKKSGDSSAGSQAGQADGNGAQAFDRNLKKAHKFFEFAEAASGSHNFDYAIECYVNGLKFDLDNFATHEKLLETGLRRKVNGGKPQRVKSTGKDSVARMLDAEKAVAFDPMNAKLILALIERIATVNDEYDDLDLGDVVSWYGGRMIEMNAAAAKPRKDIYTKGMQYLRQAGAFDMAITACRHALQLDPSNDELIRELRELETEKTIQDAQYDRSYTDSVKGGVDEQRARDDQDAITRTEDADVRVINNLREQFEAEPENYDVLMKLVEAMRRTEKEQYEKESISLLEKAYEETAQYRFKSFIDDIKMRRMTRNLRRLKLEYDDDPTDEATKKAFAEAARQQLAFELDTYLERAKEYPTDMSLQYQLGVRLFKARRYDDAIAAFQQAKSDPKIRAQSNEYLGQCYLTQDWLDEAIDAFDEGMNHHPIADDRLGLALRYHQMDAYERKARTESSLDAATRAQKLASYILQTNINYRDIRDRMNNIRALLAELREKM